MQKKFEGCSLSPKTVLQLFVYSAAFALLLVNLKVYAKEQQMIFFEENPSQPEAAWELQEDIADNVVRLHVIANSDTSTDQQLKLKVRDSIICALRQSLYGITSAKQAKEMLISQQGKIQAIAQAALRRNHCGYMVRISLSPRYFPEKQYGDLNFPAGIYQALCVEIGAAKGHNWWCVLFPSLCFVDETTAVVPEESKEKLKNTLSEDAYERLEQPDAEQEETLEIRSGIVDWFFSKEK